jgi:hypothetical protein
MYLSIGNRRKGPHLEAGVPIPTPPRLAHHIQHRLPIRRRRQRRLFGPASPYMLAAAAGGMAAYFFDPQQGKRRRHVAADRLAATIRRLARRAGRSGRAVRAHSVGWSRRAAHAARGSQRPVTDDSMLEDRVQSMVLRDRDIPKGQLAITVEHGLVVLRGELDRQDQIREIEARVRDVPGVHDVENLLHLRGTPAPNKVAAHHASDEVLHHAARAGIQLRGQP